MFSATRFVFAGVTAALFGASPVASSRPRRDRLGAESNRGSTSSRQRTSRRPSSTAHNGTPPEDRRGACAGAYFGA